MARTGRSFPAKADAGRVAIMNAAVSYTLAVGTGSYVITGNNATLTWSGSGASLPTLPIIGVG